MPIFGKSIQSPPLNSDTTKAQGSPSFAAATAFLSDVTAITFWAGRGRPPTELVRPNARTFYALLSGYTVVHSEEGRDQAGDVEDSSGGQS